MGDADVVGDLQRRLIVFDLDGTLVDSRRDLADSANRLIVERGGAPLDEDAIGRMVGEGAAVLVKRALTAAGLAMTPDAVSRFLDIYDERLLHHTRPYDGIGEMLEQARRVAMLAVLTNKPLAPSERLLSALGLREPFFAVIGGDGPYPRKPDPAGLQWLMKEAGASPASTVLVGDSLIDFETTVAAGTRVCLARYGFGYDTFPRERLDGRELLIDGPAGLMPSLAPILSV